MREGPTTITRLVSLALALAGAALANEREKADFFESKIRPLLASRCHTCHGDAATAGLRLDSRAGALRGGQSGPAVVAGKPEESLLVKAVAHQHERLKMPPAGKLETHEIENLARWVLEGAVWPESPREFFLTRIKPVLDAKCAGCHAQNPQGGLRLDSREGFARGGKSGPAVNMKDARRSLLLQAVRHEHATFKMPPGEKLGEETIADLTRWVEQGAIWADAPAAELPPYTIRPEQRAFWSFQPVRRVEPPGSGGHPIDRFILAKLAQKGLKQAPRADKRTLIRRATYDLTGLPPAPEQVREFLADASPKAFENLVERLLATPQYGERWGRHWLDVVRYADTAGDASDFPVPEAYKYRNYVIDAFDSDKPYDRFVREQIAGDELYPRDPAALVATGFNRHFPDESNARNLMQRRQELLFDITDTVASTFMGLTYGCAKCHDHKFDPILQKDYYRLQAFFANTRIEDNAALVSANERKEWEAKRAIWEEQTQHIRAEMKKLVEPKLKTMWQDGFEKFPPEIQEAITTEPGKRTPFQWHMYYKAKPQVEFSVEDAAAKLRGEEARKYADLKAELAKFDPIKPADLPVAQVMIDNESASPRTHILSVGVYSNPLAEVQPGFLTILDHSDANVLPALEGRSSGRRSALAKWLTDPENPLTTRVIVNRVWHYHFGRGIVGTPSDFGVMGEQPSHRELLDHLARALVADGWSLKKLHRRIMLSSVYQQSSAFSEVSAKADPDNKLLWRFGRRRLEGETIRDAMLAVSGRLNVKMGGPSVFPPLPPGVVTRGGWKKDEDASEASRRSVYVFVRRNTRYPMFETFDMPDTHESCARRTSTVSPSQSLELLNNDLVLDWAKSMASRVLNDAGLTPEAQVDRAYRIAYSRTPSAEEQGAALRFLDRHSQIVKDRGAAFVDFCQALLNSNEFLYMN